LVTAKYKGSTLNIIASTMMFRVGEANVTARLVSLRTPSLRMP
jgi:hypothetical protein